MEFLYLFTDGGLFDMNLDTERMVSSYILTTKDGIINMNTYITPGGTTPRAEFLAFFKGIREVKKYVEDLPGQYKVVCVVDSELVFKTFNQWIYGWMKRAGGIDEEWKSSTKEPVKNQDVIRYTIKDINTITKKTYLKITHINSHTVKKKFKMYHERYNRVNNLDVSKEHMEWLISMNELCDDEIKKYGQDKKLITTKQ